ncbi:ribonuclease H-like domain-containing protein [Tanacetum coccineum]
MANFPRLQELAAAGNSNNLTDAMSVYIQREINADLQFAVGLSQLWDVLYNRVNEKNVVIRAESIWRSISSPMSLYWLKQAPRVGFTHSLYDSSSFIYKQGTDTDYLLLYVDDIVPTASFKILMFLSQCKYVTEILERAHMINCNPSRTHVDIESKLGVDGDPVSDPTLYHSLAGAFQYLTFTRPYISYAMQHVCLYMHDPQESHFSALKQILRYVHGTLDRGLQLYSSSTSSLVAYSDADCAGFLTTRR